MTPHLTRDTMIGPFPLPEIDHDLQAQAQTKPGEWITFVDPAVDPSTSTPPQFAVQGGYHVNDQGVIDGYHINPYYEPSQTRAGFGFANGCELTLWRVLRGYQPLGMLVDSLYHAAVLSYAPSADDASLPLIQDQHNPDFRTFLVATSSQWCHWQHTNQLRGYTVFQLMSELEDVLLDINPGTEFGLRMRVADLATLINEDTPHLVERAHAQ